MYLALNQFAQIVETTPENRPPRMRPTLEPRSLGGLFKNVSSFRKWKLTDAGTKGSLKDGKTDEVNVLIFRQFLGFVSKNAS